MTTIADVRRALADLYPGVVFTFGKGRRGADVIAWAGGPLADAVAENLRMTCGLPRGTYWHPRRWEYSRTPTEAEQAAERRRQEAWAAEWDAKAPEREAAERVRRATAKVEGARKRVEAAGERRRLVAGLAAAFPTVDFTVSVTKGRPRIAWYDGPFVEDVERATGVRQYYLDRSESEAARDHRLAVERRRLAEQKQAQARREERKQEVRRRLFTVGIALPGPRRHASPSAVQIVLPLPLPRYWGAVAGRVAGQGCSACS